MSWRNFLAKPLGEKGDKGDKPPVTPPLPPLSPLSPRHTENNLVILQPPFERRLTEEAERRTDFCNIHRTMLGTCQHYNVIERLTPGDQAAALDACLLWRLVRAGQRIEQAGIAEIVGGVTVADCLAWAGINQKDMDAMKKDRRLLLTVAESLQGAGHVWEELTDNQPLTISKE